MPIYQGLVYETTRTLVRMRVEAESPEEAEALFLDGQHMTCASVENLGVTGREIKSINMVDDLTPVKFRLNVWKNPRTGELFVYVDQPGKMTFSFQQNKVDNTLISSVAPESVVNPVRDWFNNDWRTLVTEANRQKGL